MTRARSRLASAWLPAIHTPRRSGTVCAAQQLIVNQTAGTSLRLLRRAGIVNLTALSLDTVVFNQLGSLGLTPQRNPHGPGTGIYGWIVDTRFIGDRVG